MAAQDSKQHTFDSAGVYRIRVRGMLDECLSSRLGGMTIKSEQDAGQESVTTLAGAIIDQAVLAGVLDGLFNLGLTLISVELIEAAPGEIRNDD